MAYILPSHVGVLLNSEVACCKVCHTHKVETTKLKTFTENDAELIKRTGCALGKNNKCSCEIWNVIIPKMLL